MTTFANPDIVRWNEKYRSAETMGQTPDPSAPLIQPKGEAELVSHLPKPTEPGALALEVACGRGANALYLARQGYEVIAMDGSLTGLMNCAHGARHYQLPVYPVVVDLNEVILPKSHFSMISVVRYLQRGLIDSLINALQSGGIVFYKTFSYHYLKSKPTFNPEFVLQKGELLSWFDGFEIMATNADERASRTSSDSFDGQETIQTSHYVLARKL